MADGDRDQVERLRHLFETVSDIVSFRYRVERTQIVPPTALWVTQRVAYDRLILSACHPLYSAAKRIVVFGRLVDAQPRGVAA